MFEFSFGPRERRQIGENRALAENIGQNTNSSHGRKRKQKRKKKKEKESKQKRDERKRNFHAQGPQVVGFTLSTVHLVETFAQKLSKFA